MSTLTFPYRVFFQRPFARLGSGRGWWIALSVALLVAMASQSVGQPAGRPAAPANATPPADNNLQRRAYENSVRQEQLAEEAAQVSQQLLDMIREMAANGFGDAALADIRFLAESLARLGIEGMGDIADQLRAAADSADPKAALRELAAAYERQLEVEIDLRSIARTIAVRRLFDDMARQIEELLVQQVAAGRRLGTMFQEGTTEVEFRSILAAQRSITSGLDTLFQTGETLATRLTESVVAGGANANTATSFARNINGELVKRLSTQAVSEIEAQRFNPALRLQTQVIAELRRILGLIQASRPQAQQLAQALAKLDDLIERQQALDEAAAAGELTPEQQAEQQAIMDETALLAAQLESLSPEAKAAVDEALQEMAEAAKDPGAPPSDGAPEAGEQVAEGGKTEAGQPEAADPDSPENPEATAETAGNENPGAEPADEGAPEAGEEVAEGGQEAAEKPSSSATEALEAARDTLAKAADEAAAAEGESADAASDSIDSARDAAQDAQDALAEGDPEAAMDAMGEALQAAGEAAGEPAAQGTDAASALNEAGKSLQEAAQAAQRGDTAAAEAALKEADANLASAQKALGRSPGETAGEPSATEEGSEGTEGSEGSEGATSEMAAQDEGLGTGEGDETGGSGKQGFEKQASDELLSEIDRARLEGLRGEGFPPEYADWVEAYWRRLAE